MGTVPDWRDVLIILVMYGRRMSMQGNNRDDGSGSSLHVFFADFEIISLITCTEIGWNLYHKFYR